MIGTIGREIRNFGVPIETRLRPGIEGDPTWTGRAWLARSMLHAPAAPTGRVCTVSRSARCSLPAYAYYRGA